MAKPAYQVTTPPDHAARQHMHSAQIVQFPIRPRPSQALLLAKLFGGGLLFVSVFFGIAVLVEVMG